MRPISVVAVTEGEREGEGDGQGGSEREDEEEEERERRQYYLPLITTMSPPPGGAFMLSGPFLNYPTEYATNCVCFLVNCCGEMPQ